MTEQQIRDGYERLDSALVPPTDAPARVQQLVGLRRRRRRVAMAGAGALALVVGGGAVAALVSGDDGRPTTAIDQPGHGVNTLTLTRPDGTTFAFSDFTVTCKPPLGEGPERGERIWLHSPIRFADKQAGEDQRLAQPFVLFEGRLSELRGDRIFRLPVDGPGGSDTYPLTLFVADTEGGQDGNEAASTGNSSGTVRVLRASCDPLPVLELEVDVTLDSEEGKQSLDVAGSVSED